MNAVTYDAAALSRRVFSIIDKMVRQREDGMASMTEEERDAAVKGVAMLKYQKRLMENSLRKGALEELGPMLIRTLVGLHDKMDVACDNCKELIPRGTAFFHCTECFNFDLCAACRTMDVHPGHELVEQKENSLAMFSYVDEALNMQDLFARMFEVYANRRAVGYRRFRDGAYEADFTWLRFGELYERALGVFRAMRHRVGLERQDYVAIITNPVVDWYTAFYAVALGNNVAVPIHPVTEKESLAYILELCKCRVVFYEGQNENVLLELLGEGRLKDVRCFVEVQREMDYGTPKEQLYGSAQWFNMQELCDAGKSLDIPIDRTNDTLQDYHIITFTSGSTGKPKGVPMTQSEAIKVYVGLEGFDPCVHYQKSSLSHVTERNLGCICHVFGGRIGLCSSPNLMFDDIPILNPTIMVATPRFWNEIYSAFKQDLAERRGRMESPSREQLWEARQESLRIAHDLLGNRIGRIGLGGAALNPEVLRFLEECWPGIVEDGYGTTETGGITDTFGDIYPDIDFRLESVPDMGYNVEDKPHPRGELLIKSTRMSKAYFENEAENAHAFTEDGFFRTGDIVKLVGERKIEIIDRRKFIFKLAQGEFVSPSKVEECFMKDPLFESVLVTSASLEYNQNNVICAVVPDEENLRHRLSGSVDPNMSFDQLCQTKEAYDLCMRTLVTLGCAGKLRAFEIPCGIVLDSTHWTKSNGMLLPSDKINRGKVEAFYRARVDQLAASLVQAPQIVIDDVTDEEGTTDATEESFVPASGADSLSAVQLMNKMRQCQAPVTASAVFVHREEDVPTTVQANPTKSEFDTISEDYDVCVPLPEMWNTPTERQVYLLTGATGFLGMHLLGALTAQDTTEKVFCVIRGDVQRLLRHAERYCVCIDMTKVVCMDGDLCKNMVGLSPGDYEMITANATTIIHVGAFVNHVRPYEQLRGTNVCGTIKMLELCGACAKLQRFCFFSTLSVLKDGELKRPVHLAEDVGYVQTKAVAEMIVSRSCRVAGLPLTIVRPGMISWHRKTGAYNEIDWVTRLFIGCAVLRAFPLSSMSVSLVPVDFFVSCVMHALQRHDTFIEANVDSSTTMAEFNNIADAIAGLVGYMDEEGLTSRQKIVLRGLKSFGNPPRFRVWRLMADKELKQAESGGGKWKDTPPEDREFVLNALRGMCLFQEPTTAEPFKGESYVCDAGAYPKITFSSVKAFVDRLLCNCV